MESLQSLKSRLRAVKNIGQITKAMEVVSATKMRRAQEAALNSRPYAFEALRLLDKVSRVFKNGAIVPLGESRPVKATLVIVVSSDRGLAGSFNTQIFRIIDNFTAADFFITVGKKADRFCSGRGFKVIERFSGWGDYAEPRECDPLASAVIDGFLRKKWDRAIAISTHFRTTLKQEVLVRQILPVDFEKIRETARELVPESGRWAELRKNMADDANHDNDYIFEPSPSEALSALVPHLVRMQIYHLILEANASEHSARMVAMKSASDNAEELSGEITLDYNKARQAGITKEIIEIVGTQTAMT
ncbi:ATP synthase F1 subunit gamma [Candidatus Wolfebacteria bacterium]|nr:ATP synthase F1 subunit gamma [Candidatus Wolfebacteria bacterium]